MNKIKDIFLKKYGELDQIGEGSSRRVYQFDDNTVVKLPKDNTGILQNETEFSKKGNIHFAEIIKVEKVLDNKFDVLFMEYLEPLDIVASKLLDEVMDKLNISKDICNLSEKELENFSNEFYDYFEDKIENNPHYLMVFNAIDFFAKNDIHFDYDRFDDEIYYSCVDYFSEPIQDGDITMDEVFIENIGVKKENNMYTLKIIDGGVDSHEYFNIINDTNFVY